MGARQVIIEYSGHAECDIDEPAIADDLADIADPTDEQIEAAIRRDIDLFMDKGDPAPVSHHYRYERDELIASVRAELARRKAEAEEA